VINRLWFHEDSWNGYATIDAKSIKISKLNFLIGTNNSGKSRFLRQAFKEKTSQLKYQSESYNPAKYQKDIELLEYIFTSHRLERYGSIDNSYISRIKNGLLDGEEFKALTLLEQRLNELRENNLRQNHNNNLSNRITNIIRSINIFCTEHNRKPFSDIGILTFPARFYFPTLRGLRPLDGVKDLYQERTMKDYFESGQVIDEVITGYHLYDLLVECLLGSPKQRELIRDYEQKLSDVFFEGKEVTLIPEHKKDTIAVKIGDEPQFPIYDLGDGLQQVIIITSHCFLAEEPRLYFIEEPEIYMHPGLLRKLAIFLADETDHKYLMTTHSNHLFDLADDRTDVTINKVNKTINNEESKFEIREVSKDKDLLLELGVKPSSVYLTNCTLWVEGVTDRFYLRAYMKKYLEYLKETNETKYNQLSHFNENSHYAFVEYQGGVLTHWIFDEHDTDNGAVAGLSALSICSSAFLIADGDIRGKADRVRNLEEQLGNRLYICDAKEIENYLPEKILKETVKSLFELKQARFKDGIDISKVDSLSLDDYKYSNEGIGRLIDKALDIENGKKLFSEDSGTIKDKVKFCLTAVELMNNDETQWDLPSHIINLCEKIFIHIETNNSF
jgi:hypothetical protein